MVNVVAGAKLIQKAIAKVKVYVKDIELLEQLDDLPPSASKKQIAQDKAVVDKSLKKNGGTYSDSTDKGHVFEFDTKEQAQRFYNETGKTPNSTLTSDRIE